MSSSKAARIGEPTWERYREEITALYFSPGGTLPKTMKTMKERHGFQPTKSQYTTKLKNWALRKYANATIWQYVDQRERKRKLQGKDTGWNIHGIKRSRPDIEREIARNFTETNRLQLLEDIPTPEGVEVFTPGAEESSASIVLREVFINNLPLFQIQRGIEALMLQTINQQTPFNILDQSKDHLSILNSSESAAKLLQMALGDTVQWKKPEEGLTFGSTDVVLNLNPFEFSQPVPLASYFPPKQSSLSTFDMPGISPQLVALQHFVQYIVVLIIDNVLDDWKISKVLSWMFNNVNASPFSYIFSLKSTPVKIFMRKIFPAVVKSGNTKVAKEIIDRKIDITSIRRKWPADYTLEEECVSIAIRNGDNQMLELLYASGFSAQIGQLRYPYDEECLPWRTGNLEILQTLLAFKADPEWLVKGKERGFPMVDAALSGCLGAVTMLLQAESDVNLYVSSSFGTALQAAVSVENLEIAELLLRWGADPNAPYGTQYHMPDNESWFSWDIEKSKKIGFKTPLEIACEQNNISLVEMLLARGALLDICPLSEVIINNPEALLYPYKWYYDRDSKEDYSPDYEKLKFQTALQYSVQNRNIFLVRLLLSKKANPNSTVIKNW